MAEVGAILGFDQANNPKPFTDGMRRSDNAASSTTNPVKVFISYAHPDREFEQRLITDLQAAGIHVWVDHEHLSPGTPDWEKEIREGISKSNGLIYIASEEVTISKFVRGELGVADDEGVRVYPIWAKGEKWSRCVPLGFSIVQRADARGEKYESGVQAIIASLKKANGAS